MAEDPAEDGNYQIQVIFKDRKWHSTVLKGCAVLLSLQAEAFFSQFKSILDAPVIISDNNFKAAIEEKVIIRR